MLSIEEVKKFKEEDIGNVLVSIQKCSRGLRVIEDLIKGYYEDDDFKLKQENINFLVDELEIEIGYEIFLLFNGVEYKVHEDEKGIIPEGKAPLLFLIENIPENIEPRLPWADLINNRFLYTEDIENKYLNLTPEVCKMKIDKSEDFYKNIKIDPEHEAVLKKMQDQNFSVRAHEIFSLYASLLIAQDQNVEIKEDKMNSDYKQNYSYKLNAHVKDLFDKYYKSIKKDINRNENLPTLDLQDPLWINLLLQVKKMGSQMIKMKKNYGSKLTKLRSKNIIDELCHEIQDFLKKNFKEIDTIPARKKLEDKPFGPKLIKKIAIGDGNKIKGLDMIREEYQRYILLGETITFSENNDESQNTTPLSNRLKKIREFEKKIFKQIINKAKLYNEPYVIDRYIVKETSPGFYSMLDVIIEDKKEDRIFGVIIIKSSSRIMKWNSLNLKLKITKKNIDKIYIIADYNRRLEDEIKEIEKKENFLKGFANVKILSITQVEEIFQENEYPNLIDEIKV